MVLSRLLVAAFVSVSLNAAAAPREVWLGDWAHVPTAYNQTPATSVTRPDGTVRLVRPGYAPLPPYKDMTVREVVRIGVAARKIRLRFSNEFGAGPLTLGAVHVALAGDNGAIVPGSDHVVTFAGKGGAEIPPGAPLLSDALDWPLPAFAKLAVSVYYPGETLPPAHTLYALDAFAVTGDRTGAGTLDGAVPARSGNSVSEIDVVPATARQVVVAFGDSLTEGVGSSVGAFADWPDRLGTRLAASGWSVVNAGIGSNRLLHDTPSTNALSRFDRDVLAVPGVSAVMVLLGINDIQYSHRNAAEAVDAADMIDALRQLAARAHAHGLKFLAGTITPFEGSPDYTEAGEADRQAVNRWIRSDVLIDGVVDFDAALRDPARPSHLADKADGGGHLHPGDAGYAMMGDAIDLTLFGGGPQKGRN